MSNVTISLEDKHSDAITKYREAFNHGPSMEACKFMSAEDLDKKALHAVAIGKPVEDWKNRHKTPTGTPW